MPQDTTPNLILQYLVQGLSKKLNLTEDQCYPVVAPYEIDGMPLDVLQVSYANDAAEGPGEGNQEGGALTRTGDIELTYWHRVNLDQHQWSAEALTEQSVGVMDFMEGVRQVLAVTNLGGLLTEQIRYVSQTPTIAVDMDRGVFRRSMNIRCTWSVALPNAATLGPQDLQPLISTDTPTDQQEPAPL
jgi:hypothetical protein